MASTDEPAGKKQRTQESNSLEDPVELPTECRCPVMNEQEAAAITIRYDEIEVRLKDMMDRKGVVIVSDVLGPKDLAESESCLRQDLEELVDNDALITADPSVRLAWQRACQEGLQSWPAASLADVGARGRFQDRGMPHGCFAWKVRTHPQIKRVYEVLHGTSDLVSSCDNAFVANATEPETDSNKWWPHVDQNDHDTRLACSSWDIYQGLAYIWSSAGNHASTTVVWPESHVAYADYMADPSIAQRIAQGKPHFTGIWAMEPGRARNGMIRGWEAGARRIPVPAGGLLLWTSRTTHQGWAGGPRLAQPVCWEPRERRDALMRERKLRLAALGLPSTHWASLGMPHELSVLSQPKAVDPTGAEDHDAVHLPLRSSIRSRALKEGADVQRLWKCLQEPDWFTPLPTDVMQLLEDSISTEFKQFL
eukprot:TRINITY_DN75825_c0_g1_i1.p1 TRINITY_DN75825_c0_g1~~TRINITY_DN75825_c0_g1_i1.p1  ORF type:complete len:447 (-),score=81.06 TRINITY_DN75825_c0_g1_i1:252-1520(-)